MAAPPPTQPAFSCGKGPFTTFGSNVNQEGSRGPHEVAPTAGIAPFAPTVLITEGRVGQQTFTSANEFQTQSDMQPAPPSQPMKESGEANDLREELLAVMQERLQEYEVSVDARLSDLQWQIDEGIEQTIVTTLEAVLKKHGLIPGTEPKGVSGYRKQREVDAAPTKVFENAGTNSSNHMQQTQQQQQQQSFPGYSQPTQSPLPSVVEQVQEAFEELYPSLDPTPLVPLNFMDDQQQGEPQYFDPSFGQQQNCQWQQEQQFSPNLYDQSQQQVQMEHFDQYEQQQPHGDQIYQQFDQPQQFDQQFEQQFDQQFNQQFDQQFDQQYDQQYVQQHDQQFDQHFEQPQTQQFHPAPSPQRPPPQPLHRFVTQPAPMQTTPRPPQQSQAQTRQQSAQPSYQPCSSPVLQTKYATAQTLPRAAGGVSATVMATTQAPQVQVVQVVQTSVQANPPQPVPVRQIQVVRPKTAAELEAAEQAELRREWDMLMAENKAIRAQKALQALEHSNNSNGIKQAVMTLTSGGVSGGSGSVQAYSSGACAIHGPQYAVGAPNGVSSMNPSGVRRVVVGRANGPVIMRAGH